MYHIKRSVVENVMHSHIFLIFKLKQEHDFDNYETTENFDSGYLYLKLEALCQNDMNMEHKYSVCYLKYLFKKWHHNFCQLLNYFIHKKCDCTHILACLL